MREIYLDNAATTKTEPEVVEIMNKVMLEDFGNPSSKHKKGVEAEKYVRNAAEIISGIMKTSAKEIVFTSGATESNNMAIFGTVQKRKRYGDHIITSAIEHASVREPFLELEKQGYRVTFVETDNNGVINMDALKAALDDKTILVSIMHVNNETGVIQPLEDIGSTVKSFNKDIIFHVDAVQSFGKLPVRPKKYQADLLSVSAHKFHGPKGAGFLYIKDGTGIEPFIYGGGQQNKMRSGTENTPGIAGLGKASEIAYSDETQMKIQHLSDIRTDFIKSLESIEGVRVNSTASDIFAPHVVSATFKGLRSEVLLHSLEEEGIYISSGSACSSNRPGLSFALSALGLNKTEVESTVRFSFSKYTTEDELKVCIEVLKEKVPFLRQFIRR